MPALDYLNVDLELLFEAEPLPLIRELKRKVVVLFSGPTPQGYPVTMELVGLQHRVDSIRALKRWINVLTALKPESRRIFDGAASRVLDAGFKVGKSASHMPAVIEVPGPVLANLAELKIAYVVTLYPSEPRLPLTRAKPRAAG